MTLVALSQSGTGAAMAFVELYNIVQCHSGRLARFIFSTFAVVQNHPTIHFNLIFHESGSHLCFLQGVFCKGVWTFLHAGQWPHSAAKTPQKAHQTHMHRRGPSQRAHSHCSSIVQNLPTQSLSNYTQSISTLQCTVVHRNRE